MLLLDEVKQLIDDRINFFEMVIGSNSEAESDSGFKELFNDFKLAKEYIEYLSNDANTDDEEIGMRCSFLKYNTIDHIGKMIDKAKEERNNWRNESMIINIDKSISRYDLCVKQIIDLINTKNY